MFPGHFSAVYYAAGRTQFPHTSQHDSFLSLSGYYRNRSFGPIVSTCTCTRTTCLIRTHAGGPPIDYDAVRQDGHCMHKLGFHKTPLKKHLLKAAAVRKQGALRSGCLQIKNQYPRLRRRFLHPSCHRQSFPETTSSVLVTWSEPRDWGNGPRLYPGANGQLSSRQSNFVRATDVHRITEANSGQSRSRPRSRRYKHEGRGKGQHLLDKPLQFLSCQ